MQHLKEPSKRKKYKEEESNLPKLVPHAPSYLHNIDYQKFGQSKINGIMKQKYKPDSNGDRSLT